MSLERREFLKASLTGAAGVAGAGLLAGCPGAGPQAPAAHTQPRLRWRLASSFPKSLDTIFGAAEAMAARVEALTDGRFKIRVYAAGEVVPGLQVLDAVQNAQVEMGHSASYYFIGKSPALAFDACLPFGLDARQHLAWLRAGGLELLRKRFADFNVVNLPGGNTGVQMGGWFREPVRSLEDLKGLKMRIPGMGGKVMSRLGATVQVLAGGDIYPALERGAIDATEWVGPYDDKRLGFHQVVKNYHYPGWWEPGPALSFYVNAAAWEKLPASYKAALEAAAAEAGVGMLNAYDALNPVAFESLRAEGVDVLPFPDDVMKAAAAHSEELIADYCEEDAAFKALFEHWNAFRKASNAWLGTAELSYARFAFG